ncbi:hypothetical protein PVK06_020640 [Gossypium arboreum]|uniref:Uncharacterized protein n=1 Tax=Gossypium arboreum TaxID=29729 RepID=A0ABR0PNE1_GOSAR|nr:hypothetical protein PVK06_020640 [Gossypium arboreum]
MKVLGHLKNKRIRHNKKKKNKNQPKIEIENRKRNQLSSNPINFTDMKLLDDEDIKKMIALFCLLERAITVNTEPIQLFVKLVNAKLVEDITPLSQEYEVKDPCTEVPRVSVDRRSSVRSFDIDLNVRCLDQYSGEAISTWPKNLPHVVLQIHPVVIETNAHGEDGFDKNCHFNHEGEDFSDPDVDDIPDDIENKGANDENDFTPSFRNLSHGIVICNNLEAYVSIIDPDRKHASDFLEYLDIIPAHMMLADSESKKLFMG